jgi:hypothetical protein
MNIRVISVISLICLFVIASVMLIFSVSGGMSLDKAYANGNVLVIQKTSAGAIPHEVDITNNGNSTINVKKGIILSSSISQDLVIAEDKQINKNSTETIKAYCIEPSQRAVADSKLLPLNYTSNSINKLLNNSDPYNDQDAYNTQLEIWVIVSEGNLNPYTGEPVAVVEAKGITWTQFRQNLANAKNNVMTTFNVTESGIPNLNQTSNPNSSNWINDTINWIKSILNI